MVPLHAQIAGEPAESFFKRSRLPGLLDEARAAVRKSRIRADAIAAMDLGLQKGSAALVYKARDALAGAVRRPGPGSRAGPADDPGERPDSQGGQGRHDACPRRDGRTSGPAGSAHQPGPAVVHAPRRASPLAPESLVYGLADGLAYASTRRPALRSGTVRLGWRRRSPPLAVPGDPTVLVVDARHNELLRLEAGTGRLVWRLELGELVESPPLVQGDRLFQALPSGKLVVIALSSGERQATVNLGLPLSRSPVSDEQGRYLYLMGRRDCLFILARETLACLGVEYLGHEDGSIPCSPVRLGRFLVIAENDRPSDSRWRVLVLEDEGAKVRPVQQVEVPGWTWSSPASSGSIIWATGDKGGVEAYALGDYASKAPLHPLARLNPDAAASGPAFGLAVSERELWLGAGRSGKFDLDPERGEIASRLPLGQLGPALAPLQLAARRVVLDVPGSRDRRNVAPGSRPRLRRGRLADRPGRPLAHAAGADPRTRRDSRASARPARSPGSRSSRCNPAASSSCPCPGRANLGFPPGIVISLEGAGSGNRRDRAPRRIGRRLGP